MPYAYCAEMGGFAFKTSTPRANDEGYKLQRLWSDDIFELRQNGGIRQLPFITQDEKMEKSKDDFVIKAMAILQVFWMVVTVIIRATRGFPISQLEVTACAFAACTFIMYTLLWSKPQGVEACTDIAEKVRRVQEQSGISPWSFEKNWLPFYSIIRPFVPNLIKSQYQTQDMPIPNDSLPLEDSEAVGLVGHRLGGLGLGCMLLGAIHYAAWNFYLPTSTEQILWR